MMYYNSVLDSDSRLWADLPGTSGVQSGAVTRSGCVQRAGLTLGFRRAKSWIPQKPRRDPNMQ